jgi:hypothetical protein
MLTSTSKKKKKKRKEDYQPGYVALAVRLLANTRRTIPPGAAPLPLLSAYSP